MSDKTKYMNNKKCCCCKRRLHSTDKNKRSVSNKDLIRKLNNLRQLKHSENTRTIVSEDFTCAACISRANRIDNSYNNSNNTNDHSIEHDTNNNLIDSNDYSYVANDHLIEININNNPIDTNDHGIYTIDRSNVTNDHQKTLNKNESKLQINISRTLATHKKCFICKPHNLNQKLKRLSINAIVEVYVQLNILIPEGARCCQNHFNENEMLSEDSTNKIIAFSETTEVNPDHLKNVLESFRILSKKNHFFSNFESINTLTDDC